jgi:hypothetical protein
VLETRVFLRALLPIMAGSCACSGPPSEAPTALGTQPVVNGRASPAGTREDAIVLLRTPLEEGELVCSGTLVADNLVLTARHCVARGTPGPFICTPTGELLDDGSGAGALGLDMPADTIEVFTGDGDDRTLLAKGATVVSSLTGTVCVDDLAFVVLDRKLELPPLPLRIGGSARVGEAATLTGYGLDETMNFGTPVAELARNTRDDLEIELVGPLDRADATTIPPRAIVLSGAAGCVGDSGGPLYATATGAVLGVYSMLAGDSCTSMSGLNFFAHVPVHVSLIADAFDAAGAEPILEDDGTPPDDGAGGAGGAPAGDAGNDSGPAGAPSDGEPNEGSHRSSSSNGGCAVATRARAPLDSTGMVAALLVLLRFGRRLRAGRRED